MTEQEYIDTKDLARLETAIHALREIVPDNSSVIDVDDLKYVIGHLMEFQSLLREQIEIKESK